MIIIFIGYAGVQYVPAYITALQFHDYVTEQVKYAASAQRPPEDVRKDITEHAAEVGISLRERDIRIKRKGVSFTLEFEYKMPIDLRLYRHDLTFDVAEMGETFERARY